MNYDIVRGNNVLLSVRPVGSQTKKLMSVNVVQLSFDLPEAFDFTIGDSILVYNEPHYLNQLTVVQKENSREFHYECTFEAEGYNLAKVQYMMLGDDNTLKEADFSLMGNAETFIKLLLRNANRISPGWNMGTVADTEFKNLTFSKENCLQVLSRLAEEFNTEFWIENKTIHLATKGAVSGLAFEYGKGKGLYKITRNNVPEKQLVTRLYAYGGSKNLPATYRNYSNRLKLPFLHPDGVTVQNGVYLEENTEFYGVIEHTEIFEDIYPHRTGTITNIAESPLLFEDSSLDFDVNAHLLPGLGFKVVFNTGQLAGYEFEGTYNAATKVFALNKNEQEKAMEVPSALLRPSIGDEYVLVDLLMPDSYIVAAEKELHLKAQAYLDQNCSPRVIYAVECDPLHFKKEKISLKLGDYVKITDADLHLDRNIRITGLVRDLHDPYAYQLELADTVTIAPVVRQYAAQEKIERVIALNRLTDVQRAKINYKSIQEYIRGVFDPEGNYFTEKIKPLFVETMGLLTGSRSQQFILRDIRFAANYQSDANRFAWTSGSLHHFTIADSVKVWQISGAELTGLDPSSPYFIYARCSRTTDAGEIVLNPKAILVDADPSFYHFTIGELGSVIDNFRPLTLTYGFSFISGREITTGKIKSADGLTSFDLDTGEIEGKIKFGNNGTSSIVDGNLITSGNILLGNEQGVNAGVIGEGSTIRFFAGDTYANREVAPFRVYDNGLVYMNNAVIEAAILAKSGKIGNWEIDNYGLMNDSDQDAYIINRKSFGNGKYAEARIGSNILPPSSGIRAVGYFVNQEPNPFGTNYGVIVEASGGGRNIGLSVRGGFEMKGSQSVNIRRLEPNITTYACQEDDFEIIYTANANGTIQLPSPTTGRKIRVKHEKPIDLYVVGQGNNIYGKGLTTRMKCEWTDEYTFDGVYWQRLGELG
ncbi:hypothetical protein AHMF7605_11675 [Adhaeribacter arboris]|uniref:Prophage tail endopeptidase domain-containing protein n=1 Tax=Adhaeribacter arboris TaxID=2072846 RepID=A0A2T2YF38_9BACT|nr:phage tail protein [Adhaeribacter arboris]PSR54131.1 hypothetical protein AHMF7605_11675 [Adhaeribacter arboris]